MSYVIKQVCFNNALAQLRMANTFAHRMFCRQELAGNLTYEKFLGAEIYNEPELPELNSRLVAKLERFLKGVDEELYAHVLGTSAESAMHQEVRDHFSQDRCPLELEQEFEQGLNYLDECYP